MRTKITAVCFAEVLVCLLIVASFSMVSNQAVAAEKLFVLNSGANNPLFSEDGTGFYNVLAEALFKRLGVAMKAIKLPSERALLNLNRGVDDGNIARIKGLEKKYPNLIRVPEKVLDFEFMAYATNADLRVTDWNSLEPHMVAIITGWKIYEKNIVGTKGLTKVKNPTQLFTLLAKGRTDIAMFDRWQGLWWINRLGMNRTLILLEPPIAHKAMYIYVHKKHVALVPKMTDTLLAMKADGSYQQMFAKVLQPLAQKK